MQVNVHQAKTHLSRLLERAAMGEEIVIAKAGRPLVRLVPVSGLSAPRRLGTAPEVADLGDGFDASDPAIERLFYGARSEDPL